MRTRLLQILPWLIVGVGLILRLPLINGSFWLDEAAQALESSRPINQQFQIVEDFQPPLLHLILHVAQYVSHHEWWLRSVGALLPGLATILATYFIGVGLGGRKLGVIASLLLATSSFHIYYSQELRPYALPALLATLSWLRILRPQVRSHQFDWPLAAVTFLGIFSSYLYPFALLSQAMYVFISRRSQVKGFFMSVAAAAFGFLPWMPFFIGQLAQGGKVQALLPGWSEIVGVPQIKSLPLVVLKFVFGVLNVEPTPIFLTLTAVIVLSISVCLYRIYTYHKPSKTQHHYQQIFNILGWWILFPILTAWLISFLIPILQPKRVLFTLPAWYLGIAGLYLFAENSKQKILPWIGRGLIGAVVLGNLWSTSAYFTDAQLQRENWRDAYHAVTTQYPPDVSLAVFAFPQPFASWRWYDKLAYPSLSTKSLQVMDESSAQKLLTPILTNGAQYIIIFDYLRDITDPNRTLEAVLNSLGYTERQVMEYPNIGFIRIFSKVEAATAYEYRN